MADMWVALRVSPSWASVTTDLGIGLWLRRQGFLRAGHGVRGGRVGSVVSLKHFEQKYLFLLALMFHPDLN